MIIMLPPSETKSRPTGISSSSKTATDGMSFDELNEARHTMLRAAAKTAGAADGGAKLGVPKSAPELLERMAHLAEEPVGPPLEVYTGVLFEALGPDALQGPDHHGSDQAVGLFVMSALFGIVDCSRDLIPAYRLSASSTVHRLGKVGPWWKNHLEPTARRLEREAPVIVDCRSGPYRSMMPLSGPGVLAVKPVAERDGNRTVISHDPKRYRGLVARALLAAGTTPTSPDEVADTLREAFGDALGVELDQGARGSTVSIVDYWDRRQSRP